MSSGPEARCHTYSLLDPDRLPVLVMQSQVEYVRQRGIVLQELRQAKAEAEAEEDRRKILARIGSSLVDGAWR